LAAYVLSPESVALDICCSCWETRNGTVHGHCVVHCSKFRFKFSCTSNA